MAESEPPKELTARTAAFLAEVESVAPGLVTACHVTGSGANEDWQPDSDIDLVFVTDRALTDPDAIRLESLHAATSGGHPVDGIYLTAGQVDAGPDDIQLAPQSVGGSFEFRCRGGQLTWVTWLEMAQGFRAPVVSGVLGSWSYGVGSEAEQQECEKRAREACRKNLHSYWLPYVAAVEEQLVGRADDDPVAADVVEWIALGAPRLVVTIETGRVSSKSAAAVEAAKRWPQFSELLTRVVASRAGEPQVFTVRDSRLAVALVRHCIVEVARR
jgi:hypothetical protein